MWTHPSSRGSFSSMRTAIRFALPDTSLQAGSGRGSDTITVTLSGKPIDRHLCSASTTVPLATTAYSILELAISAQRLSNRLRVHRSTMNAALRLAIVVSAAHHLSLCKPQPIFCLRLRMSLHLWWVAGTTGAQEAHEQLMHHTCSLPCMVWLPIAERSTPV